MSVTPLVPEVHEALPRLSSSTGPLSWISSVDHKQIGIMYLIATFFFFIVGGVEALLMRIQLGAPGESFLKPEDYNQLFTMHGATMIFLVIMPMLIGFSTYFAPLMIGANDMAFPRLNALSYWLFLFGGLLLYASFLGGGAPDAGWFAYAPLSSEFNFTANAGMNYWGVGIAVTGAGTISAGVNLLVTILTLRAPGMTLRRIPLFVWMTLLNTVLILAALPALNASIVMLLFDRLLHANFFNPAGGGQPLLWQHAFWSFGHPEVYIMILPAWGIISEVVPVFSRRPIFGYEFVAGATLGIVFLSMVVWGHHMFVSGMGQTLDLAFGTSSLLIAIPTGIKVFNWVATTWGGAIRFTTSMCFALAFIVQFTIGGVTGVMFGAFPIDWQMEDSYFVVAHLHYVLMGGSAFAMFAGIYYWFPKVTGKMLSEKLGMVNFWLATIGFNLAFMPQHFFGLPGHGPPRLHLPGLPVVAPAQPPLQHWRGHPGAGRAGLRGQPGRQPARRRAGRRQPLARLDAGVGDLVAARLPQLPRRAASAQPPSAVGSCPSREPRLEEARGDERDLDERDLDERDLGEHAERQVPAAHTGVPGLGIGLLHRLDPVLRVLPRLAGQRGRSHSLQQPGRGQDGDLHRLPVVEQPDDLAGGAGSPPGQRPPVAGLPAADYRAGRDVPLWRGRRVRQDEHHRPYSAQ
jgi:cytochrome c oxidase subunit 1/cytochrome c oxidase subunit I+III